MKKSLVLLTVTLITVSCNKKTDDFVWEKSFGQGDALYIKSASDSGIVSCGTIGGFPYLLKLKRDRTTDFEYTSGRKGLFNSAWSDTSRLIAGGSSDGKMLLACIDNDGSKIWDTVLAADFKVELSGILYSGNGILVAVGTAKPDSAESVSSGIFFVKFDTAGQVIETKEVTESTFIAANRVTTDGSGNILLAVTRKRSNTESQAGVIKYTSEFNKLWETDLYNNPDFGAASRGIITDDLGTVFVTGSTEFVSGDSVLNNSFLVSLGSSGSINWKKYIEKTNSGVSLRFDVNGSVLMLNTNCFIINIADPEDGSDLGKLRMFDVCNSKDTDAFGRDIDLNYDGNILVAGSKGGNYYLALKSLVQ
jgi:hypothetical protein